MNRKLKLQNLLLLLILCTAIFFTGCVKETPHYNAGQYMLSAVILDDQEIPAKQIYPRGGYLLLAEDGQGWLSLGEDSCAVTWESAGTLFTLHINDLIARGTRHENDLTLSIDELDAVYAFTKGAPPTTEEASAGSLDGLTAFQSRLNGTWQGRMWFSETTGEWADQEDRSMAVTCSLRFPGGEEGKMELYNSFYSDEQPMADLEISTSEEKISCNGGYFMSFPLQPWGMAFELTSMLPSQLRNSIIMHPDIYEYGHYYLSEEEEEEEAPVDVLLLSGRCEDADGGFAYSIQLTREN